MFTRMAKGLLWILMIAIVIVSVIGMIAENVGVGLAILLLGFVCLFFFGVWVELINNVLDIRNTLKDIQKQMNTRPAQNVSMTQSSPVQAAPVQPTPVAVEPVVVEGKCAKCGYVNNTASKFCMQCGSSLS